MKTPIYILILVLLLSVGCKKKKYPETVEAGESPFYLRLKIDSQPLEINAGKDNYYMYSYISRDTANVFGLVGEFKQAGCTICPNSLKIEVKDSKPSLPNAGININSIINLKGYEFLGEKNDSVSCKVVVNFTDAGGVTYTSRDSLQPVTSVFRILSIEDYVNDINNTPVKKVKLNFTCRLYNGSKAITIEGIEAVVGLSYQ